MSNTIYASFVDSALAEKAAGALLDHGVRADDISIVRGSGETAPTTTEYDQTSPVPINEQTWTGENRDREVNRMSYTGNAYETEKDNLGSVAAASELAAESHNYGNVAEEAFITENPSPETELIVASRSVSGQVIPTQYPTDREIENSEAMSADAVGHDPNNWQREDRAPSADLEWKAKEGLSTTTAADAGAGALKGAGWGAGIGIIAAIASLAIPGVGLVIGGGALAAAIGAAVATTGAGAAAGAITGYLKDQGMEDHVAAHYDTTIRNGGALIAVQFPSGNCDETVIRGLLEKYGAAMDVRTNKSYIA